MWPVGIPALIFGILWYHRYDLSKEDTLDRFGALYAEYEYIDWNSAELEKMTRWETIRRRVSSFWEVWEIIRRLFLASILIFILKDTAEQRESSLSKR